jgi:hypothetical protein
VRQERTEGKWGVYTISVFHSFKLTPNQWIFLWFILWFCLQQYHFLGHGLKNIVILSPRRGATSNFAFLFGVEYHFCFNGTSY